MARKKHYNMSKDPITIFHFIPLLFIVGILPLIVFAKYIEIDGVEAIYWRGGNTHIDFFSYYKAIYFIITSYFGIILLLFLRWLTKFRFKDSLKIYIPLSIYALFAILSFFNSEDKGISAMGFIEMYQGLYVLIGYVFTVILTFNLVRKESHIKWLINAFIVVGVITSLIGFTQYFGFDLFKTTFGKRLILPSSLHHLVDELKFTFGANTIYATMYNTNFVGSFAAMLLPISVSLFFYAKRFNHILLSGLFVGLMAFVLFGSNSRAGLVGVGASLVFMIILYRKQLFKTPLKIILPLLALIITGVALNIVSNGRVMHQITRLNPFVETEPVSDDKVRFEALYIDENELELHTSFEDIKVKIEDGSITFSTIDDEALVIRLNDDIYTIDDEKYDGISFKIFMSSSILRIYAYGEQIDAYFTDGIFSIYGVAGGISPNVDNPRRLPILDNYERIASGRVYIWSRSIGMLPDTIFLGYGPDMYNVNFPQRDIAGRLNSFSMNSIIDKPHNMYLQIGINTGVISLLSLLVLYAIYGIDSLLLFIKRDLSSYKDFIGVGVFTGIIGYLTAAFFNDQIISVAPLFYVLVGLGFAINRMIKQEENKHIK